MLPEDPSCPLPAPLPLSGRPVSNYHLSISAAGEGRRIRVRALPGGDERSFLSLLLAFEFIEGELLALDQHSRPAGLR